MQYLHVSNFSSFPLTRPPVIYHVRHADKKRKLPRIEAAPFIICHAAYGAFHILMV